MHRKIYIKNDVLSLSEYLPSDNYENYNDWLDTDTQNGYNFKINDNFYEFQKREVKSRFNTSIIRSSDGAFIGIIGVSPINTPPDLAIRIFNPYRRQGYGTNAFKLGIKYCFETLKLDKIYAGYYPSNIGSRKILEKCGFQPHPEGNLNEKHYLTGEDIIQLDNVLYNHNYTEQKENNNENSN
jgi:RimJ/RimL family protein N-acetyltransferase